MDKLAKLKYKCEHDLKFLTQKVIGLPRWSDTLHGDLEKFMNAEGDKKLVLLPRGHQKSTLITVCWTIQQLLKNPNETVMVISATWSLSRQLLEQIKNILIFSPLKEIYGNFQTPEGRWTNQFIDIAQKNAILTRDPSVNTAGIDTGKTGTHCSLMIFDDVVSPENTTTPEQIRKTIDGYQNCLPLLNPGGKTVVIGTRYVMSDLYGYLIDMEARSLNGHTFESGAERKKWRDFLPR